MFKVTKFSGECDWQCHVIMAVIVSTFFINFNVVAELLLFGKIKGNWKLVKVIQVTIAMLWNVIFENKLNIHNLWSVSNTADLACRKVYAPFVSLSSLEEVSVCVVFHTLHCLMHNWYGVTGLSSCQAISTAPPAGTRPCSLLRPSSPGTDEVFLSIVGMSGTRFLLNGHAQYIASAIYKESHMLLLKTHTQIKFSCGCWA